VEAVDGKLIFTMKFHHTIVSIKPMTDLTVPALIGDNSLVIAKLQNDWELGFINFIMEAKVPPTQHTKEGGVYYLNKYSTNAMKVFRRAIEKEGVVYEVLVRSTFLYYKSIDQYKKTIANYFTEGIWRTDYMALVESLKNGTVETHIKTTMSNDAGKSQWQLG